MGHIIQRYKRCLHTISVFKFELQNLIFKTRAHVLTQQWYKSKQFFFFFSASQEIRNIYLSQKTLWDWWHLNVIFYTTKLNNIPLLNENQHNFTTAAVQEVAEFKFNWLLFFLFVLMVEMEIKERISGEREGTADLGEKKEQQFHITIFLKN